MKNHAQRWVWPASAGTLLITLLFVGGISLRRPPGLDEYFLRVRESIDAIPWRIGGWNGKEVPPTPGARRLLRPNVIVQRQYTDEQGRVVAMLIVHCGNVRDMDGHYPPICYPGLGWRLEGTSERTIGTGRESLPATDYSFTRREDGLESSLLVTDFFVLPSAEQPVHARIDAVRAASRSAAIAGLGSAQIQFVSSHPFEETEWSEILKQFASELSFVIDEIGDGIHAQQ